MKFNLSPSGMSNTSGYGLSGTITLYAVNTTASRKFVVYSTAFADNTPLHNSLTGTGIWKNTANALEAVRFLMTSGNITSGKFKVYGIAKS